MYYPAEYCSIRRGLESNVQVQLVKFSAVTTELCMVIGKHREWTETRERCRSLYNDLAEGKHRLRSHRHKHGC